MFIDSHCHLDFSEFDCNRQQLIQQCHAKGINHFIVPGVSLAQSQALLSFVTNHPSVRIAAGLHPYFLADHQEHHLSNLFDFAKQQQHQLVAIGECGLDRSIDNIDKQIRLFEAQIELANQVSLPLIVHHRQSHDLIAQSFKRCKPQCGGVIHAFSGSQQQASYYIKQGFKLGVGGVISYSRAHKTRTTIAAIDTAHLVLETDAPSMPLSGSQGQVNTPLRLLDVFAELLSLKELKKEHEHQLAAQLYQSCLEVFRI
ncbi:TatD family hydrolase [Pseudoalteromonas mariniglutinosa]|uniref:TatD family hydrolase n=1 Tax=Pseudoalteromonas mariniglutinosa TaxID=206042 RepID=UPI00384F1522